MIQQKLTLHCKAIYTPIKMLKKKQPNERSPSKKTMWEGRGDNQHENPFCFTSYASFPFQDHIFHSSLEIFLNDYIVFQSFLFILHSSFTCSLGVKWSRTLCSLPPMSSACFCLWKNFSQRISLIREVRKCRNKAKQSKEDK